MNFERNKGSLLCTQKPATSPYHEPEESNPHPNPILLRYYKYLHSLLWPTLSWTDKFLDKTDKTECVCADYVFYSYLRLWLAVTISSFVRISLLICSFPMLPGLGRAAPTSNALWKHQNTCHRQVQNITDINNWMQLLHIN